MVKCFTMTSIIEIDDSNFEGDMAKLTIPVLLFFKSEWCPTCKKINPIIESISDQYIDKVKFIRIDAVKNIKVSQQNNVLSIPTLILFKNGKEVKRNIGDISENQLKSFLNKNL
ncbi:MAG: thioredoxin domain-containing protein [Candidatus Firestonebacteria bacterium]